MHPSSSYSSTPQGSRGDGGLDVGCGCGAAAVAAAAAAGPAGRVVGVDSSAPMLDIARQGLSVTDLDSVELVCADAQTARLPGPFDVMIGWFGTKFSAGYW